MRSECWCVRYSGSGTPHIISRWHEDPALEPFGKDDLKSVVGKISGRGFSSMEIIVIGNRIYDWGGGTCWRYEWRKPD